MLFEITLDEIKIQEALGTLSNASFYEELYHLEDIEILKFVGLESKDYTLRRAVATNMHTPYSILRQMYKYDLDYYVREIAWGRVVARYERRFGSPAPLHIRRKIFISNFSL